MPDLLSYSSRTLSWRTQTVQMAAAAECSCDVAPCCVVAAEPPFEHGKPPGMLPNVHDPDCSDWIVVFDFDWTMVDENTDTHCVIRALGEDTGRAVVAEAVARSRVVGWTIAMDEMHHRLALEGIDADSLLKAVAETPMTDEVKAAVKELASRDPPVPMAIVSDANSLFIAAVLERHGLTASADLAMMHPRFRCGIAKQGDAPHIALVATNPAQVEPVIHTDGEAEIAPAADRVSVRAHDVSPVGCPNCPINMCKGRVLHAVLERAGIVTGRDGARTRRIVYAGDGGGDFCPSVILRSCDVVLARAGFTLAKRLASTETEAVVYEWIDGPDLAAHLLRVVGP